ncbi:palindromic element RPE1 domain-containing protein [Candidatus Tisiphia endosymbiont of Beris chalybata]|uniref:palindromic element RPE1 domain-containing protein n=1 Tax=Candidatus Tisiphia endosymbiont of Beris chalybata TaxID=3066262 RepID=UPI00312C94BC
MHNLKIIEEFLGETKSSTAAYIDVREEQRGVSTTKLPIRLGYARGLMTKQLLKGEEYILPLPNCCF